MAIWILQICLWSILLGAFYCSIYYWNSYKNSAQRYFPHFLFFTVLIELTATFCSFNLHKKPNIVYNIYLVVSMLFYLTWLTSISKKKALPKIFILVFVCSALVSVFTESVSKDIYGISFITGSLLILFGSFLFFKQLIEGEEAVNFLNNQQFWIMSGLLIFHIGFLPVYLMINYLNMNDYRIAMVIPILNILLYGCFIIGFRCRNK